MKSFIISGAIGTILLLALGIYYVIQNGEEVLNAAAPAAVITVLSSGVSIFDGSSTTTATSGDAVIEGMTISTDATGEAELLFPSGSIARLDTNTIVKINAHFFDEESGTSDVSIFLSLGRIWSRVAKLATPASQWEVKTSNVVAAVRGTAFNVGFTKEGKSRILVDKNAVKIKTLAGAESLHEAEVKEGQFTEFDENSLKKGAPKIAEASKDIREDAWILKNKREDTVAEDGIRERERVIFERAEEFRKKLKERNGSLDDHLEKRKTLLKAASELRKIQNDSKERSLQETEKKEEETATERTPTDGSLRIESQTNQTPNQASGSAGNSINTLARPTALSIRPAVKQSAYFEGKSVSFQAFARYSDKEVDVTNSAVWSIRGPIGRFSRPGLLETKITDIRAAEFGKAEGSVSAAFEGLSGDYLVIILSETAEDTGTGG